MICWLLSGNKRFIEWERWWILNEVRNEASVVNRDKKMDTNWIPSENVAIDIKNRHNNEIHLVQHFGHTAVSTVFGNYLMRIWVQKPNERPLNEIYRVPISGNTFWRTFGLLIKHPTGLKKLATNCSQTLTSSFDRDKWFNIRDGKHI